MRKKRGRPWMAEQMEWIDVAPESAKEIIAVARRYKAAQAERLAALEKEVSYKQKILEEIHKAKLQPLEGGVIRFRYDGIMVTVKPRDELLTVKRDNEE